VLSKTFCCWATKRGFTTEYTETTEMKKEKERVIGETLSFFSVLSVCSVVNPVFRRFLGKMTSLSPNRA
jgi:hypothetical protein